MISVTPHPPAGVRGSRRCVFALAAATLVLAPALAPAGVPGSGLVGCSSAQAGVGTRVGGLFSVSPARRKVVARPPVPLAATTVSNTTGSTLHVSVFPVLLGQESSGAFTFDPVASEVAAARRIVGVGPTRFILRPGSTRQVGLLWRRLPARARTAAVGIVYQAIPSQGRGSVGVVERLLGVDILRVPGHYRVSGQLVGTGVSQVRPGVVELELSAHNSGQAAASPSRLVLTVRNRRGVRVLNRQLPSDIVLPGATRSFVLDVSHPLPAGAYVVHAHMTFGSSRNVSVSAPFELVAPNTLSAAHLEVGPLTARGTSGHSAEVSASLRNTGTESGGTAVQLSLYRLDRGLPSTRPVAGRRVAVSSLGPGKRRKLESGFGRLRPGEYRLLASYYDSSGAPQTLVADFQAENPLGAIARLRRLSYEHALLIPFVLLLLNGTMIAMVFRERRLRRRVEGS